jgi:hypothetical protein
MKKVTTKKHLYFGLICSRHKLTKGKKMKRVNASRDVIVDLNQDLKKKAYRTASKKD